MPAKASSIHGTTSDHATTPREGTSQPPPSARLPGDAISGGTLSHGTLGREAWMNDGAVARERGRFHDLVVPLDRKRLRVLVHQDFQEGEKVLGVEARSGRGDAAPHGAMADDLEAARLPHFAPPCALAIAAPPDPPVPD